MNKTILVLEDEKPLLDVIESKIRLCGCEVVSARSVDQALNYMKEVPKIDCIWLDHYLFGEKNGLDFVSELKNNEKWKNIPIFVVSNTASPDKIQSYLHLGVSKYFTKSNFKLEEIMEDIKKVMEENNG
jgi:CheY-like chemotaxis protein